MIPGPLTVAHQIWSALGEDSSTHTDSMRPIADSIILTKLHYDYAAKRAYHNSSATVTDLQYAAINFAVSPDQNKHAFVFMGYGTGKCHSPNLFQSGVQQRITVIIVVFTKNGSKGCYFMEWRMQRIQVYWQGICWFPHFLIQLIGSH
jgi:hypothetical protein